MKAPQRSRAEPELNRDSIAGGAPFVALSMPAG